MIGSSVGPYRILQEIGAGGMGEVYLALDERLGRRVALKSLSGIDVSSPATRKRLLREAKVAAKLNHPNIAAIYDVVEAKDRSCIVMEYVEGETLSALVRHGPILLQEALRITLQVCDALTDAHAHGVIHRDLKPANIRITPDGRVKVLDFGLAIISDLPVGTTRGTPRTTWSTAGFAKVAGTPGYMSPEQILARKVDHRSDLYSTGILLFELVTGRQPFKGANLLELVMTSLSEQAPDVTSINPCLPAELNSILARAMAKDPQARYSSAAELRRDIRRLLPAAPEGSEFTEEELKPLPSRLPFRFMLRRGAARAAVIAAALTALILLSVLLVNFVRNRRPGTAASRSPVVIVLPFANMSGNPSRDYISAGIRDSLTIALARLPGVRMISGAVVDEYVQKRGRNPAKIATDLDATMVVDGGVQESGGRVRVTASLVKPDGSIAWPYDDTADLSDIFSLQARLAEGMGTQLQSTLSEASRRLLAKPPTTSLAAFEDYSRARTYMERRDLPGNLVLAIQAFQRATTEDPKFAAAHAGLGDAYWLQYQETRQQEWISRARDEIYEALRLDPDQAAVRVSLAQLLKGTGRSEDAASELRRAIQVQPNNDDAHRLLGLILAEQGQTAAAIAEVKEAIRLRPDYWMNHSVLAAANFYAGRLEEAARSYKRVTELQPDNAWGFLDLGTTYMALGKTRLALENLERSVAIKPDGYAYANIGTLRYWEGDFEKSARACEAAIKLLPNEAWIHRNLGDAYARLGQRQESQASYAEAVRLSEELLRVDPGNAIAMAKLAVYETKLGRKESAKRNAARAFKLQPGDKDVLYCKAAVHALQGESEDALAALRLALKHGYGRMEISKDDDLSSLRPLPAFQEILSEKP